jgi:hypothetical protein
MCLVGFFKATNCTSASCTKPVGPGPLSEPTIVGRVLCLPRDMTDFGSGKPDRVPRSVLLDIAGRKVMDLKPGVCDIHHIAPGVHFVRRLETEDGRPSTSVRKVVIQR